MKETDLQLWKNNPETRIVLSELAQECERAKEEILNGYLIISPSLEKEYCRAIGYIKGLEYIYEIIKKYTEEDNNES